MGGDKRPETNLVSNAIVLCGHATSPDGCHRWVENHRAEALALGLLVSRYDNPSDVPVQLRMGLVLLGELGEYIPVVS